MSSPSKIVTCQTALLALLQADARPPSLPSADPWPAIFHSDTPIVTPLVPVAAQVKGDIEADLTVALNKIGAGVVVMLPKITRGVSRARRIDLQLQFIIGVATLPTLNNTTHAAEEIMERVMILIEGKPNGVSIANDVLASLFSIDPNAGDLDLGPKGTCNYLIRVNTEIHLP